MRKIILFCFLLVAILFAIGILSTHHSGHMVLTYDSYRIETSLWMAITLVLLAYFILYYCLYFLRQTVGMITSGSTWWSRRKKRKADSQLQSGFDELLCGNWHSAKKSLSHAMAKPNHRFTARVGLALAAHGQHRYSERDRMLDLLFQHHPQYRIGLALLRARLHMDLCQYDQAIPLLESLQPETRKYPYINKLLWICAIKMQDWGKAYELSKICQKQKLLSDTQIEDMLPHIVEELLKQQVEKDATDQLQTIFQQLPHNLMQQNPIRYHYLHYLARSNQTKACTHALKKIMHKQWQPLFVNQMRTLPLPHQDKLKIALSWYEIQPQDPAVLHLLAWLYAQEGTLKQAKGFYEKLLNVRRSKEIYAEYANVLYANGDYMDAGKYYQQACTPKKKRIDTA